MYPQQFIDHVKEATNIVKLIKKYTELTKVGEGIWQGHCPHPDHNDSDPSFRVWEKDQSWACMGCHYGKKELGTPEKKVKESDKIYGSDCFAFLQWVSKGKTSWKQALLELAKEADIPVPTDANQKLYNYKKLLAESYIKGLNGKPYNYLANRGLTKDDMLKWGIGFDGKKITFPLYDRYRNVLGFTKRWIGKVPEGHSDKYKNSPNSKIFNKSYYLYGIHLFDDECDEIRITEGAMDVIIPHKYGVKNIFATLGTAFTDGHVELIKHYGKIPVFCMDGDPAGFKSIQKAADKLAAQGIYSKILLLPNESDMADLALMLKNETEQYIQDNAITYGYFKMKDIIEQYQAKVTELKVKLYPQITEVLKTIPHDADREVIKNFIAETMQLKFDTL